MEYTTNLELQSQTTRLGNCSIQITKTTVKDGILTLCDPLFQKSYTVVNKDRESIDYNAATKTLQLLGLSSSLFTRRY